jgi:hypothetical protein
MYRGSTVRLKGANILYLMLMLGLVGVVKNSGMDLIETQLKLAAQKWKAKCRMTKHDQSWQDEDVSLSTERDGGREGERVTLSFCSLYRSYSWARCPMSYW